MKAQIYPHYAEGGRRKGGESDLGVRQGLPILRTECQRNGLPAQERRRGQVAPSSVANEVMDVIEHLNQILERRAEDLGHIVPDEDETGAMTIIAPKQEEEDDFEERRL